MNKTTMAVCMVTLIMCMTMAVTIAGDRDLDADYSGYTPNLSSTVDSGTYRYMNTNYSVAKDLTEEEYKDSGMLYTEVIIDCAVIPASAFENSTVWRVVLTDTVETICADAFRDCDSLISVEKYGNTDITIESGAFAGCTNLSFFDARTYATIADDAFDADCDATVLVDDSRVPDITTGGIVTLTANSNDIGTVYWRNSKINFAYIGYGLLEGVYSDGTSAGLSHSVLSYGDVYSYTPDGKDLTLRYMEVSVDYSGAFGLSSETIRITAASNDLAGLPDGYDGVEFTGWSTSAGKSVGTTLEVSEVNTLGSSITLVPVVGDFTVTFAYDELPDSEGITAVSPLTTGYGGTYPDCKDTAHYAFAGWYVEDTGETYAAGDTIELLRDHTATAQWEPKPYYVYRIVYLNSDGSEAGASEECGYGQTATVSGTITAAGTETQTFDHWTDASGSTVAVGTAYTMTDDVTLTPVMADRESYLVTYVSLGTEVHTQTAYDGWPMTVDAADPSRDGYRFAGWSLEGAGGLICAGDEVLITAASTMTASWAELGTCTVTFKSDGTVLSRTDVTVGETVKIHADVSKDGYVLSGWTDGEGTFADGSEAAVTDDVTFTAVWTETEKCEVRFHLADGTVDTRTVEKGTEATLDAEPGTRDGYSFVGWSETEGGEKAYDDGQTVTVSADMDLYPVWTASDTGDDSGTGEDGQTDDGQSGDDQSSGGSSDSGSSDDSSSDDNSSDGGTSDNGSSDGSSGSGGSSIIDDLLDVDASGLSDTQKTFAMGAIVAGVVCLLVMVLRRS